MSQVKKYYQTAHSAQTCSLFPCRWFSMAFRHFDSMAASPRLAVAVLTFRGSFSFQILLARFLLRWEEQSKMRPSASRIITRQTTSTTTATNLVYALAIYYIRFLSLPSIENALFFNVFSLSLSALGCYYVSLWNKSKWRREPTEKVTRAEERNKKMMGWWTDGKEKGVVAQHRRRNDEQITRWKRNEQIPGVDIDYWPNDYTNERYFTVPSTYTSVDFDVIHLLSFLYNKTFSPRWFLLAGILSRAEFHPLTFLTRTIENARRRCCLFILFW